MPTDAVQPVFPLAAASADPAAGLAGRLWAFAGDLHPLVVHFPIALLIVGGMVEFLRFRRGRANPGVAGLVCVAIGAATAVIATAMGWSSAQTAGYRGGTVEVHRWLGVAVAVAGAAAAAVGLIAAACPCRRRLAVYRIVTLAAAVLVGVAGHFGASLVHGEGYLRSAWARFRAAPPSATLTAAGAAVDFERDILPILSRRCYSCHSGENPEAGLRLDTRDGALAGGESGSPAIVPGRHADSRLYQLVSGAEPSLIMPPKGAPLTADEQSAIAAWIDAGAPWLDRADGQHWHWAYRPPVRPNPPPVKNTWWPRNAIDHFILARLEAEGLSPSPEADKATLLRRVSLDLTGLPPTPEEIDAFLADESPDAYERVVDRLLASPHYGEHWARLWLDLARYADTHGYEKDARRVMWPYRDWVIDALNRDLPYDQFSIEQLAGDLLPDPTLPQLIATGFHRNTMTNEEGGVDPEEFRVEAVIDRVNTTAAVWLGTTLACAQCHDHKHDPFTQRDYYRLFAIFNNDEPDAAPLLHGAVAAGAKVPVPARGEEARFKQIEAEIGALEATLATQTPELEAAMAEWETRVIAAASHWAPLTPASLASANGVTLTHVGEGVIVASGENPPTDTYTIEAEVPLATISALRLDLLTDASVNDGKVGRGGHGNIVVTGFGVSGEALITLSQGLATHEQSGAGGTWPIAAAIDSDTKTGWAIGPRTRETHSAIFRLGEPIAGPARLTIRVEQDYGGVHTIGRLRLSATGEPWDAVASTLASPTIEAILRTARPERTAEQQSALAAYYRSIAPALALARARLAELRKERASLIVAEALVLRQRRTPRETHIHIGGSFLNKGEPVSPGTPAVLPPLPPDQPANRLALARWLFDPAHPLTARVAVNRFWEQYFGRGLVETSDDFGTQGEPPTHPELLDYLATEFIRQRWSMKAIHRLIVTSAAYRQASNFPSQAPNGEGAASAAMIKVSGGHTPAAAPSRVSAAEGSAFRDPVVVDPENKLLWRFPRRRVEAEAIRDIALAASGLLSRRIGGPSVFPPQPEGIWTMIYSDDTWVESKGEDKYRRGLYTFWRRTAPYPTFVAFDAPSRETTCTRRPRTNTPLQALTTLNDPAFVEAAAALARRVIAEAGPAPADRLTLAFRLCTGRRPDAVELARLERLLADELAAYESDPEGAALLAGRYDAPIPANSSAAEVAAYTVVANVLLNLDETLTKN